MKKLNYVIVLYFACIVNSFADQSINNQLLKTDNISQQKNSKLLNLAKSEVLMVNPALCSAQSACGGSANDPCPSSNQRFFYQCSDGQMGCAYDPSCR